MSAPTLSRATDRPGPQPAPSPGPSPQDWEPPPTPPPPPPMPVPEEARGPATSPTGDLPRPYSWSGSGSVSGAVRATVVGGRYTVDTVDLAALSQALSGAAAALEDATGHVAAARQEVEALQPPARDHNPALPLPGSVTSGSVGIVPTVEESSFYADQQAALTALDNLSGGPGGLGAVAKGLRDLADDVTAAGQDYERAERCASQPAGTYFFHHGGAELTQPDEEDTLGTETRNTVTLALARVAVILGLSGADALGLSPQTQDYLYDLDAILQDQALTDWLRADLMTVVGYVSAAARADEGGESAELQAYLAQVAARIDPQIYDQLPDVVQVGSQYVGVSTLTPMQRVATYLAMIGARAGVERYGAVTGVSVTPRAPMGPMTSTTGVTVPPGAKDPFGLRTHVGVSTGGNPVVKGPASMSDLIRYSNSVQSTRPTRDQGDDSCGVVSLLRTQHADGSVSWVVVVPGTSDWGMGGTDPQDLLTNLQAVGGAPTDMETAVVTAMRQAGVQPGEAVGIYGHSQGAVTAVNIAGDPAVNGQFNITHVLTAGGPVAGADIPPDVTALHLENTSDAVTALDASSNPVGANRLTVVLDTQGTDLEAYPHGALVYADAVENMAGDQAVDDFGAGMSALSGGGEEGAVTTEYVYDVRREHEG